MPRGERLRRGAIDDRCHYCSAIWASEIEHVHPRTQGGSDADGNRVPACRRCNAQKSGKTPAEWRDWRLARGMSWPPPNCDTVSLELAAGLDEADIFLLRDASLAQDRGLAEVVVGIHDRYHRNSPAPVAEDQRLLLDAAKAWAAARFV